ncbi:hypothetical protein MKW94_025530 [Papaver nudicaule]|uniref:Uncharacterized protein n=1 Tax=Papaver nudicaule TaxID=74823 RepID=A0AA41UW24_PAPNU|nr:hypothetical protein [Papaver nudicaule]
MASSFSSILVCNVGFLFLMVSMVLVSASENAVRSVHEGALTGNYVCDPNVNVYTTQIWGPTRDCIICTSYCFGACDALRTQHLNTQCTPSGYTNLKCECCCAKPTPPPAPACPPPAPLPPSPPCPSPPSDTCETGDTYTEITMPSSDCAACSNWCQEDCSELGGRVIEDKCAIGESSFVRRCKCCCREPKSGPKIALRLGSAN